MLKPKFLDLLKLFDRPKVRFDAKFKMFNFIVYIAIFLFFYLLVHLFRTYHFASGYVWLDPWVQIGYGQAFPDTAWNYRYYKESRILSISLEAFFLQFSPYIINFFWEILASLTALVIYRIARLAYNNVFTSLVLGAFTALSPFLWGDWAGGGDYYNTFGNLISAFAALQTFVTSRMILSNNYNCTTRNRRYIITGILFAIVALETPSGIILLVPLQFFLILSIFYSEPTLKKKFFIGVSELLKFQFLGFIYLVLGEILYLILLGESPIRLYAGPKFLFDNLTDPSIANAWAEDLNVLDFISHPNLFFFASLFALQLAFVLSFLVSPGRKGFTLPEFGLSLIPILLYIGLLLLQFSDRTILFTTTYFLTPVLILGICFISNSKFQFRRRFFFFLILSLFFLLKYIQAWHILATLLLVFFLLLSLGKFELTSGLGLRWRKRLVEFFLPSMLMVVLFSNTVLEKPSDFHICESARIDARAKVIEVANKLDSYGFKRGTLLMGADLEVLRKPVSSDCDDFNGKPLSNFLIAVAETGFPFASSLGKIESNADITLDSFAEDSLAFVTNRVVKPTTCYINWERLSNDSQMSFSFMEVEFGATIKCPENV